MDSDQHRNLFVGLLRCATDNGYLETFRYSVYCRSGISCLFYISYQKADRRFLVIQRGVKIFILFIIPTVILYFFSLVFAKWIEPDYPQKITEITLNTTTELMEKVTDDQEAIDQAIEEAEVAMMQQFNPSIMDVVKSLVFSVLVYFVGAMIWAAIFKKDRPVFYSPTKTDGEVNE